MNGLQILMKESLYIPKIGKLYIPKVKDVVDITEYVYDLCVYPFSLSFDLFEDDEIEQIVRENLSLFELFFMKNDDGIIMDRFGFKELKADNTTITDLMIWGLEFFFKAECINYGIDGITLKVIIEEKEEHIIINKENYDFICDLILKINNIKKKTKETLPKFTSERQKDIYEKLMKGRARKAKENEMNLQTIINVVVHGGKDFIPYKEIMEMTIPQFYNTFYTILTLDNFNREYKQLIAGCDPKDLSISKEWWTQQIKIKEE